jgi:hypothetical protein
MFSIPFFQKLDVDGYRRWTSLVDTVDPPSDESVTRRLDGDDGRTGDLPVPPTTVAGGSAVTVVTSGVGMAGFDGTLTACLEGLTGVVSCRGVLFGLGAGFNHRCKIPCWFVLDSTGCGGFIDAVPTGASLVVAVVVPIVPPSTAAAALIGAAIEGRPPSRRDAIGFFTASIEDGDENDDDDAAAAACGGALSMGSDPDALPRLGGGGE